MNGKRRNEEEDGEGRANICIIANALCYGA